MGGQIHMNATKQLVDKRGDAVLLNVKKIAQSIGREDIQAFVNVIDKEIGKRKLEEEEIERLREIMNIDGLEAVKWKTVADVLKYISFFAVAESHPEDMRRIVEVLLGIIGTFCPMANTVQGYLAKVPDEWFPILIKMGGLATPEYLIYKGVNTIAQKKLERAKSQEGVREDVSKYEDIVTVIIVCKSKPLSTETIKLIETEDDIDNETIVGVKDGTVQTILWNEAAWEAFCEKLTGTEKVLIIDDIKHTNSLTSQQIRFEKFGVKYGWNGNVARIEANPKELKGANDYQEFLSAMDTLEISPKLKKNAKFKFDWTAAGKLVVFPPLLIADLLSENTEVKKQQLLFGLYSFYMQDMDEFLNQKE